MRFVVAILCILFLAGSGFAQTPNNPGDEGLIRQGPPGPFATDTYKFCVTQEIFPSGDGHDGWVWYWNSFQQKFDCRPPHLLFGPSDMSVLGSIGLTANTWNSLGGAIQGAGFRNGFNQYPPRGTYLYVGAVALVSPVANTTFYVKVTYGNAPGAGCSGPCTTTQPAGFLVGNPIDVNQYAVGTSPSSGNLAFSIPFNFIVPCFAQTQLSQACEITVWVYPTATGTTALKGTGQAPNASIGNIIRLDGLFGGG